MGPVGAEDESLARAMISTIIRSHSPEFLRIDIPVSTGLSHPAAERGLSQVEFVTKARLCANGEVRSCVRCSQGNKELLDKIDTAL